MDTVIIAAPADYEWATDLADQLASAGYRVYIEPPQVDSKIRQRTIAAMREARAMIAVVTTETALGDSAEIFEAWWRPFAENGRTVIPCLPASAPKGAKNWMPHDLYQYNPINFGESSAFVMLTKRLGKPKTSPMPMPPALTLPKLAAEPQQPSLPPAPPAPPPPPTTPKSYPDVPDVIAQAPEMGLLNYISSIVAGLVLVVIIWGAALQSDTPLLAWLVGIAGVMGALFVLGRIELARRQTQQWVQLRWRRAQQLGSSTSHPLVYVEILDSTYPDEQNTVWDFYGTLLSIGCAPDATIPLWRYKKLDNEISRITYADGQYFLDNSSTTHTLMVVGQPLLPQASMIIHNGDVIALPDEGLVFQFRVGSDELTDTS